MKRFFKNKVARHSATASLDASTRIPDSGFAFVNNSQGASASIVELANALDDVLNNIEFEGEASDFAKLEIKRLDDEASKYSNSRFVPDMKHQAWSCRSEDASLLLAAAKCSAAVYQPADSSILTGDDSYSYHQLQFTKPSALGTVKAMGFYEARELNSTSLDHNSVLVVAIRGSASKVDHMVNINNQSIEAREFISLSKPQKASARSSFPQVHSGFLNGAEALAQRVANQLARCENDKGPTKILFTGHSAGAVVASLLFQHFLASASTEYPSLIFSCITFGSPPFCNPDFASLASQMRLENNNCHLHVNFLNEFDLVPRLDRSYVLSLIDLYRSRFSPPPMKPDGSTDSSLGSTTSTLVASAPNVWPLPAPLFVHPGEMVLLSLDEEMDYEDETVRLRATQIDSEAFGSLLFCRIAAHKVAVYLANMATLRAGNLNR